MKIKYNNTWLPITEAGKNDMTEFDKRFPIDRKFTARWFIFNYWIRFVQHPECPSGTVKSFIIRSVKMPKWYWRLTEKYMRNFLPVWLIFTSKTYILTHNEVLEKFGYEI